MQTCKCECVFWPLHMSWCFFFFFCPFLMNWGKKIVWKSGSRRGYFNAAIIEVRVCLPFNHTMPEKQKSTSTVISFSLLTCSLKLKDIPIIQGEPLMHIHKGHYLEEECQNSPEGACFVFPRINVYMFVLPRWHSFKGSVHKTKIACISVYALSLFFLCHTCTNEFCIQWMYLSTIHQWFIILPVVLTKTMGRR